MRQKWFGKEIKWILPAKGAKLAVGFAVLMALLGVMGSSGFGLFGLLGTLLFWGAIIWLLLIASQCPKCGKFFAIEAKATVLSVEDAGTMKVERKIKNNSGNVIGTYDDVAKAERVTRDVNQTCKYCGYIRNYTDVFKREA